MDILKQKRDAIDEIDSEMASLFVRRMQAASEIAAYKKEHGIPILDEAREAEVIRLGGARVSDAELQGYYRDFLRKNMELSRQYQKDLRTANENRLHLDLPQNGYDIILERGALARASELLDLDRRVLIVTDDGVPAQYAETLAAGCKQPTVVCVKQGEGSKSFPVLERLCRCMMENGFTRTDCVVAVGGGVVGDLAGFAAASFMRGIDFYNVPTTVLSQVDSSIGGKVAINLDSVKNVVGAFYQPKRVLIDPDVLKTLPHRQIANGFAEAVKMALTFDAALFEIFENGDAETRIDEVIERSLLIKKRVVEQDEKESGLRKVLNFGHTLGHGVEALQAQHGLYHGECVALGMLPMCAPDVRTRLTAVLERLGLPTEMPVEIEDALSAVSHDKKCDGKDISVIWVEKAGAFELRKMPLEAWCAQIRAAAQP